MNRQERIRDIAYANVRDALELKVVASTASRTKGVPRAATIVYRELRDRAAAKIRQARELDTDFSRRVWRRHRDRLARRA